MSQYIELDSLQRDRETYPNPLAYELLPKNVDTWVSASRDVTALPSNPNQRPLDFVSSLNVLSVTLPYPRVELFTTDFVTVASILANVFTFVAIPPPGHTPVNGDVLMTSATFFASLGIQAGVQYYVVNATPTTFQLALTPGGAPIVVSDSTAPNLIFAILTPSDYAGIIAELTTAQILLMLPRIYLDFHSNTYKDTRMIRTINGVNSDAKFVLIQDRIQFSAVGQPMWIQYKSMQQTMRFKKDDQMTITFTDRNGHVLDFFTEDDLDVLINPQKQSLITIEVIPYLRDNAFSNHNTDPIN